MGLFSIFKKSSQVYYPGCMLRLKFKEKYELYKKMLDKLDIDYKTIDDLKCCGLIANELGYQQESRKLVKENLEVLKDNNITKIITTCPDCQKMFKQNSKELVPDWNIEVVDLFGLILKKLNETPSLVRQKFSEKAAYSDSSYLSNYLEIIKEPREILSIIGFELAELQDFAEDNFSNGSSGGLLIINPELARDIAAERILQAKRRGVKKIIVASINDYALLSEVSLGTGIEIIDFFEALAKSLGLSAESEKKEGFDYVEDLDKESEIEQINLEEEELENNG
ncbi:MAG: (Fe-S)-binding protein [Candidatus Nanoarchaeia archaeon]